MECYFALVTALHLLTASPASAKPDFAVSLVERRHVQTIIKSTQTYEINVGGIAEPENVDVEFIGPMARGWVAVEGGWDSSSLPNLADSVLRPRMSDQDKAWAIWGLIGKVTFRMSLHASSDPLELINVYGFGYCSTVNRSGPALWQVAGLKARGYQLHDDYNCEVFFDDHWHLMNVYMRTYYLDRNGDVPASAAQLVADPWLVERNVTPAGGDAKEGVPGEVMAGYFATGSALEGDFTKVAYSPRINLRQRERLMRSWSNWGAWSHSITEPSTYGNGRVEFDPDLSSESAAHNFESTDNVAFFGTDHRRPLMHLADSSRPGTAVIKLACSAYPIVGGELQAYAVRSHANDVAAIDFSVDGSDWTEVAHSDALGEQCVTIDLDDWIPRYHGDQHPPDQSHQYYLRLRLQAANAKGEVGFNAIRVVAETQHHPRVLPALKKGGNVVRFTAGSVAQGAQVIHRWKENHTLRWLPEHPYEGEQVTLEATVRNVGDAAPADPWDPKKRDAVARFYESEKRPENQIGSDQRIGLLGPGESTTVRVAWTAHANAKLRHGGEANNWLTYLATPIIVVVDPEDLPGEPASMAGFWERREDNNECIAPITVSQPPQLLISEDYITAQASDAERPSERILIATVRNACIDGKWLYTSGTAVQNVRVRFFAGDPEQGGSPIAEEVILDEIGVGRHAVARVPWNPPASPQPHNIYVRVGPYQVNGKLVNDIVQAHKVLAEL